MRVLYTHRTCNVHVHVRYFRCTLKMFETVCLKFVLPIRFVLIFCAIGRTKTKTADADAHACTVRGAWCSPKRETVIVYVLLMLHVVVTLWLFMLRCVVYASVHMYVYVLYMRVCVV